MDNRTQIFNHQTSELTNKVEMAIMIFQTLILMLHLFICTLSTALDDLIKARSCKFNITYMRNLLIKEQNPTQMMIMLSFQKSRSMERTTKQEVQKKCYQAFWATFVCSSSSYCSSGRQYSNHLEVLIKCPVL